MARPFVEFLDFTVCREFKQDVERRLLGLEPPILVVDLRDVHFLDSMAIGALVGLRNAVHQAGGQVALCNLHPNVLNVLKAVTVDAVFGIFDSLALALNALADEE